MSDTLIEYTIDGAQPRMRISVAHKRTREPRTTRRLRNLPLDEGEGRGGGRGGEERRSVARPPKVKSRGGTGRNTGGESPAAIKRKHKIKGKSGARERRAIARLGGWIRCGHLGSFLGYLYVR